MAFKKNMTFYVHWNCILHSYIYMDWFKNKTH